MLDKLLETFRPRHRLTPEEYLAKLTAKGLNPDGTPKLDPVPLAPPIGYKKSPSMVEIVRDMVRSERLAQEALRSGHETFEEAEDFDVGDEPDQMPSPWENEFEPDLKTILEAGKAALAEKEKSGGGGGSAPAKAAPAAVPAKKKPVVTPTPLPEAPDEP